MKIDAEFGALLCPLTADELAGLEASLLEEGCREALIVWHEEGILLDGHNRKRLCEKHCIPFQTSELNLPDRNAAMHWIICNQLARRNLTPFQKCELALRLEPIIAEEAKNRQREAGGTLLLNLAKAPVHTRERIAEIAGVSPYTLAKSKVIIEKAPEEIKAKLRTGETSIHAEYLRLKVPHVLNNSGDNEWYTPEQYVEAARAVMGGIDLDPASSEAANAVVKAEKFYAMADNGLSKNWAGRTFMNPPYAQPLVQQFCEKLCAHVVAGQVTDAIVLVNNATETQWFQALLSVASAVCFPAGRIRFWQPNKQLGAPLQGQAMIYYGEKRGDFKHHFKQFGAICYVIR